MGFKERMYKECDDCTNPKCSKYCFNDHPGSIIALKKNFPECYTPEEVDADY